ncbi:hypothetical protein CHGG_06760 [Chaetomium globosum CBS 148.51]|uniref:HNH nuclease domain-containing protein n=1 Tax=Chaetomium globosum (strain ATCC 6205 / CBS 148.51 / DSM 1962 / NBRC 6347 / NRRL 1970) TaxID=306901 RepID=Q2H3K5_CHAGB|nr:uncharacterized protein CHGG_06760 [Chaetomium globosum CBS 148.51]EAQ90141.1 hypothetical protein CHGG_06760 [Chaetomium globosum CBS 148.51]
MASVDLPGSLQTRTISGTMEDPTAASKFRLRPPLPPPIPPSDSTIATQPRTIAFRHPGYPDFGPNLLSLIAVDGGQGIEAGIDYDTALVACGIVACNNWSQSWFGIKDRSGGDTVFRAVPRPEDGILRESTYYFFVNQNQDEQYPVFPSFDHWRFPHRNLPELWQALDIPPFVPSSQSPNRDGKLAVAVRDQSCCLTAWTNATEASHLIPFASSTWFLVNNMSQYCRLPMRRDPVDDDRNLILLRRDLHLLFDQRHFTILPKRNPGDPLGTPSLVFHTWQPRGDRELHHLFHNRTLQQPTTGLSVEFLLARFAWSIFREQTYPFLTGIFEYTVQLFNPATRRVRIEIRNSLGLFSLLRILPSRTFNRPVSPAEQKVAPVDADSDAGEEDDFESDEEEDDPPRGRSRERKPMCMARPNIIGF